MKQPVSKGVLWNEAAKTGVLLGLVPVLYMFLNQFVSSALSGHAVIAACLNFILWLIKFALCIWIMMAFMKKFAETTGADNSETFKYGMVAALCSAVIVAAFTLANMLVINPEVYAKEFDAMIESYSSMLDSNSMQVLDSIRDSLPVLSFFINLVYCFLFGLVLSYILSRSIPPRNPLARMIDEMRRNGQLDELEHPHGADEQDADVRDADERKDGGDSEGRWGRDDDDDPNRLRKSDFR